MRVVFLFFMLVFLSPLTGYSQSYKSLKAEGNALFEDGFYALAVERYEECFRERPTDYDVDYRLGISYLMLNRLFEAETVLHIIEQQKKKKYPLSAYYLGYLNQRKLQFKQAAKYYKEFLKTNGKKETSALVRTQLRNCESGLRQLSQKPLADVERLPEPINSVDNDFHPIFSPSLQQDKIYFSSNRLGVLGGLRSDNGKVDNKRGHRKPDMFIANRVPTIQVERMSGLLNTPLFDEIIGFSYDGARMYYKKGYTKDSGLLYEDFFKSSSKERLASQLVDVPFDMAKGDATPFFFMDTLVIFASQRLGGFGGYDLFFSEKTPDGWTEPVNMGNGINTEYDEMYPFLTNNKESVYYSSNNPNGIGGMDIYKSTFNPIQKKWHKGQNMGIPINSADNDEYFYMANDGWHFLLSSNRKEALGKYDIFEGQFFEQQSDQVVMAMSVESEKIVDTSSIVFQPVLFQQYPLGTIIPDSNSLRALDKLIARLRQDSDAELVLQVTKTANLHSGNLSKIDPLSTVLLSRIRDGIPNCPINYSLKILKPETNVLPGTFVEAAILTKYKDDQELKPINAINKYHFVPRVPKGLRYRIEVDTSSRSLVAFLGLNIYDFSVDVWPGSPNHPHLVYGQFLTYETAKQWAEQLAKAKINIIQIVPYISGKPIFYDHIHDPIVRPYPDLIRYLGGTAQ